MDGLLKKKSHFSSVTLNTCIFVFFFPFVAFYTLLSSLANPQVLETGLKILHHLALQFHANRFYVQRGFLIDQVHCVSQSKIQPCLHTSQAYVTSAFAYVLCWGSPIFEKTNLSRQTKDRVPAEITLNKTATKPVSNTWEQGQRVHPKRPWRGASHKHNLDANWRVWQDEEKKGSVLELAAYLVAKYLVPVDLGSGDGKLSAQSLEGCVRHCHVVLRQSPLDKTTTQKQLFVMFMAGFIQKILLKFTNISQTFAIWCRKATQRYATFPHIQ